MSQDLKDAPLCSECGQPMEETTSANPQLHHGGVPFACQSNPDCPEYAPDGVGTVKAVNLLAIAENHIHMVDIPRDRVSLTISCQKCGGNELTLPDEANEDSHLTCSSCGADGGRWGDVQAAVLEASGKQFEESFANAIGQGFDGEGGITFKKVE